MFAIGIRYLCGWSMATHPADRERPEWPPHPDRVFMALAAAYFESDGDPLERDSLLWLERQGAPALAVSECHPRSVVTSYVPVNDLEMPRFRSANQASAQQLSMGLALLPEHRIRQARQFPVAIPDDERAYFIWRDAEPSATCRSALAKLCGKVTALGHSASLVQAWVDDCPPGPTLVPVRQESRYRLRITGQGSLDRLAARFEAGLRPTPSLWSGYNAPIPESKPCIQPISVFDDDLVIFRRLGGPQLASESTLRLTQALRDTVMATTPDPQPEWITGHKSDRTPSECPHAAFFSLPDVGHAHADGHLLGVALAIPRAVGSEERARCLRDFCYDALGSPLPHDLTMGPVGRWRIEAEDREERPIALRSETWCSPARRWATTTPIVLDRYPKTEGDAEETIKVACERIGLPRPIDVVMSPMSLFEGVPPARQFPPLPAKFGKSRGFQTHAVMTFESEVRGPLLLCAGRYRGYGVCRPWRPMGG
jgi:CRISPR-associated protein Csb2